MRIDFQFTLNDWIEWKRANLSKPRLLFLRLVETYVVPLIIAGVLTFVLSWLRYIPGWSPIVVLVLIAVGQIHLSMNSRFGRRALRNEWLTEIADQKVTVELNDNGFDYVSEKLTAKPTWDEVASVYQTKHLLMFCSADKYVLLIPKRAFRSKKQLEDFLEVAYKKTVLDRQAASTSASA
jgi:hypothetical protein